MKYIPYCLFQSLNDWAAVLKLWMLSKITNLMEKSMQKKVGDGQNVEFLNSHLPTNAPECIWEGTLPEHLMMIFSVWLMALKNIDGFDLLESFSNGTHWFDRSYVFHGPFLPHVIFIPVVFLVLASLICNSYSRTFFASTLWFEGAAYRWDNIVWVGPVVHFNSSMDHVVIVQLKRRWGEEMMRVVWNKLKSKMILGQAHVFSGWLTSQWSWMCLCFCSDREMAFP